MTPPDAQAVLELLAEYNAAIDDWDAAADLYQAEPTDLTNQARQVALDRFTDVRARLRMDPAALRASASRARAQEEALREADKELQGYEILLTGLQDAGPDFITDFWSRVTHHAIPSVQAARAKVRAALEGEGGAE